MHDGKVSFYRDLQILFSFKDRSVDRDRRVGDPRSLRHRAATDHNIIVSYSTAIRISFLNSQFRFRVIIFRHRDTVSFFAGLVLTHRRRRKGPSES